MSVYKLISKRRSIRRFLQHDIPIDILTRIVDAARLAPSAANLQPLEYIVIDNPGQVKKVFPALKWAGYIRPHGNPPKGEEPVAYIVVLNNTKIKSQYVSQDSGAAIENMILTAMEENVGSCWVESIDKDSLRKVLELPDHLEIKAVLALGYPGEMPQTEELQEADDSIKYWKDDDECLIVPKRKLNDIIHYNLYNKPCPTTVDSKDWPMIFETSFEDEAYLIQGFLQNNEIPCVIEALKFREYPVNFSSLSQIRLLVPKDKLEEAKKLLVEREKEAQEEDSEE